MTLEDKKALQRWSEHHKALAADVPVEDWMSKRDIEKKRTELEKDPITWIRYFFPKYAKYEFAPFHIKAIRRVIEHDEWYDDSVMEPRVGEVHRGHVHSDVPCPYQA